VGELVGKKPELGRSLWGANGSEQDIFANSERIGMLSGYRLGGDGTTKYPHGRRVHTYQGPQETQARLWQGRWRLAQ